MHLVQILLPLRDGQGRAFPKSNFDKVAAKLTSRFGGVTAYTRTPAEGRWKHGENPVSEDDVVIVEVMVAELDKAWWRTYRITLEKTFKQKHVIVRVQPIEIL
jgi:hypothetical protein